jgi:hypothetical protein
MNYVIAFIMLLVILFVVGFYWYSYTINEDLYGKAIKIDESICIVKRGNISGKKRITYKCDNEEGCYYNGRLRKGVFYVIEDCVDENTLKGWYYSKCGPYYGANEILSDNSEEKTNDIVLLDEKPCRACLSLDTGHPKEFQDMKLGFTGIVAKCQNKCKVPELQISTRYENQKFTLAKIRKMISEKTSDVISIDGNPYILQPCYLKGSASTVYFQLVCKNNYLIIKDNQVFSTDYCNMDSDVYFSFENMKETENSKMGSLICYRNVNDRGWLDKNFKWHSGFSKIGSLIVVLKDNKITDLNGNAINIPSADEKITTLLFDVVYIENLQQFVEDRFRKKLDSVKN